MSILIRIKQGIRNWLYDPAYKIGKIAVKHMSPELIPDRLFLKYQFHYTFGYKLNLLHPESFNEKLQWLKLYDRNPLYTTLVDKNSVKQWVADRIGQQYIIPTLAMYHSADEIDIQKLPDRFVLKCNHDSGSVIICKDKSKFNLEKAKISLSQSLSTDFYIKHREWPYKNVPRRIIAESYLGIEESHNEGLIDYKIFCFSGQPQFLYVSQGLDNQETAKISFMNLDWSPCEFGRNDYASFENRPTKPEHLDEMIEIAKVLSKNIPFVRIDFYEYSRKVYFSEFTLFPCAGLMPFSPKSADKIIGSKLVLPL